MLKVGDRVKMTKQGELTWGKQSRGGEGTLKRAGRGIHYYTPGHIYQVDWDDGNYPFYGAGDIELVSLEATIDAWLEEDALC